MNDRFKFRVWHKKRKKMYEVLHFHVGTYDNGGEWATVKGFNIITQQKIHIQVQPKDCILMQSTGLHDKNGKLIYEGDIVNVPDNYNEFGQFAGEKYEIYFKAGGFRFKPKFDEKARGCWLEDNNTFEVIGNIYQHKELLEKC